MKSTMQLVAALGRDAIRTMFRGVGASRRQFLKTVLAGADALVQQHAAGAPVDVLAMAAQAVYTHNIGARRGI